MLDGDTDRASATSQEGRTLRATHPPRSRQRHQAPQERRDADASHHLPSRRYRSTRASSEDRPRLKPHSSISTRSRPRSLLRSSTTNMPRNLLIILLALLCLASPPASAARRHRALRREIEQLREAAYFPTDRVMSSSSSSTPRSKAIQELFAHPRQPGREQDTHDLTEAVHRRRRRARRQPRRLRPPPPRHPQVPSQARRSHRPLGHRHQEPHPTTRPTTSPARLALESIRDLREAATQLSKSRAPGSSPTHPPKTTRTRAEPGTAPR